MSHTLRTSAIRAAFATVILLLIPILAMHFTDEVNWDLVDFLVAGALLFTAGFTWQLAAARTGNGAYRIAMGIAIVAMLLLVWGNLAVGIIGAAAAIAAASLGNVPEKGENPIRSDYYQH